MKSLFMTTAVAALLLGAPLALAADDNKDQGPKSGHETSQPDRGRSAQDSSGPKPRGNQDRTFGTVKNTGDKGGANSNVDHDKNQGSVFGNGSNTANTFQKTMKLHKAPSHASTGTTTNHGPQAPSPQEQNKSFGAHAKIDLHTYQGNIKSDHHFHAGDYRAPHGYSYRHWSYGDRLPSIYFGRDYWIGDFGMYDLMSPPDGYVWVRFGPDAILIDEYTGEIVRVEYGVFY